MEIIDNLTLEQKIVYFLAKKGYITNIAAVFKALKDFEYAEKIVTIQGKPGIKDDIADAIVKGEIEGEVNTADCDHESLTNEEIQKVFDNDNDDKSK